MPADVSSAPMTTVDEIRKKIKNRYGSVIQFRSYATKLEAHHKATRKPFESESLFEKVQRYYDSLSTVIEGLRNTNT